MENLGKAKTKADSVKSQIFFTGDAVCQVAGGSAEYRAAAQCTAGHEGAVGDISCVSIFSACFVFWASN